MTNSLGPTLGDSDGNSDAGMPMDVVDIYVCIHTYYMYICMCICKYTHTYVCIHVDVCMYVCMYRYIYIYIYVCTCISACIASGREESLSLHLQVVGACPPSLEHAHSYLMLQGPVNCFTNSVSSPM